jgi:hypothetical protein
MKISNTYMYPSSPLQQKQGNFKSLDAKTLEIIKSNDKVMQELYDSGSPLFQHIVRQEKQEFDRVQNLKNKANLKSSKPAKQKKSFVASIREKIQKLKEAIYGPPKPGWDGAGQGTEHD